MDNQRFQFGIKEFDIRVNSLKSFQTKSGIQRSVFTAIIPCIFRDIMGIMTRLDMESLAPIYQPIYTRQRLNVCLASCVDWSAWNRANWCQSHKLSCDVLLSPLMQLLSLSWISISSWMSNIKHKISIFTRLVDIQKNNQVIWGDFFSSVMCL